ncbi:MAG: phenylacetate-CoA oxygenase subunit PaaC [Casimicrobiaceae bacterium]|nr:phenylacetate-CoA oxygenase subunit PaaC [Casimicrobiaceae bacterium]
MSAPERLPDEDVLTLADTCLLLGHRLSEWCGHGPILEEDIALANRALDLIGQARRLYQLYCARVGGDCTEDRLAYLRDPDAFCNVPLAALPNGDYAQTMLRAWALALWFGVIWEHLERSNDCEVAVIAADALKEARLLARHAGEWVVRFGDGTAESRQRLLAARARLAPAIAQLLEWTVTGLSREGLARSLSLARSEVLERAELPDPWWPDPAGCAVLDPAQARRALLAEMQSLAREYPEAVW